MVEIGMARRSLEDMSALLRRQDNQDTSAPAPPEGLYFAAVVYPPELYANPLGEPRAAVRLA
jgi:tRNA U38,U39,U40 pseudouridine synthase TruA